MSQTNQNRPHSLMEQVPAEVLGCCSYRMNAQMCAHAKQAQLHIFCCGVMPPHLRVLYAFLALQQSVFAAENMRRYNQKFGRIDPAHINQNAHHQVYLEMKQAGWCSPLDFATRLFQKALRAHFGRIDLRVDENWQVYHLTPVP